ncbi:MAG: hypothetical protein RLZZ86_403 [Cyanobacteriota bacterium]|jgi:hypothetical protein
MTHKHETPQAIKDKLKADVESINKMKADLQTMEKTLQDVIAAYILGAGLPQTNIRFDEEFNLLYDDGVVENYAVEELEDLEVDSEDEEPSTFVSETTRPQREAAPPKPRIR